MESNMTGREILTSFGQDMGIFSANMWTINDFDGNLTKGVARIRLTPDGYMTGSVDYSAGTNYNPAETSPIIGLWLGVSNPQEEQKTSIVTPDTQKWT